MLRVICLLLGYLMGSIVQSGFWICKFHHIDIRQYGSGNAGTTNVIRTMGKKVGYLTYIFDAGKCIVTALIIVLLFGNNNAPAEPEILLVLWGALGCVLGHNFPFYLGFKGGKGIAASTGLILSFMIVDIHYWYFTVIGFIIFMTTMYVSRYVSLASLVLMTTLTLEFIITAFFGRINATGAALIECNLVMCALTALAFFQHRANIVRLISGTENKIGHHVKVEENLASESGEKNE